MARATSLSSVAMGRLGWALGLALVGCTGSLTVGTGEDDGGVVVTLDGDTPAPDGGLTPRPDGAPPGPDSGPTPPVDGGPVDPCAAVSCQPNASCQPDGSCRCDEGFSATGGDCVALPPGDPALRTEADVCDAWRMGHVENASPAWTAGPSMCDPGTMAPAAIDDTLRRVNMFRWLAGLGPVPHNGGAHDELMECAHMMSVNGRLSHNPPMSWSCYTSGGASAAGRSNIALGYRTPGSAINGYMGDRGTPSLGHRRWILSPRLGSVEIGFAGRGQCLGVFDRSGSSDRDWTAYPNQGFAPLETAQYTWSFQVNSISLQSGSSAEVVRTSDGMSLPVEDYQTGGMGPPNALGFTPMGWTPQAGETYRVTITDTSAGDITYETTLVDC